MARTTAEMVKDYLKAHFYVEDVAIPYENSDGKIMFFINKYKVQEEIEDKMKEQIKDIGGEQHKKLTKILYEILRNPLVDEIEKDDDRRMLEERLGEIRKRIALEERSQIAKIIERKFEDSAAIKRTKGFYKTIIDMLGEKDEIGEYKFDKWQKLCTPHLYNLEQGIYIEDSCKSKPKCGYCGDYIFLRKKIDEDIGKGDAKLLITNLEQGELIQDDIDYVFGSDIDINNEIVTKAINRLRILMITRLGKPFRERFNASRITDENKNDVLENWEIYKNIEKVKEEFETYK